MLRLAPRLLLAANPNCIQKNGEPVATAGTATAIAKTKTSATARATVASRIDCDFRNRLRKPTSKTEYETYIDNRLRLQKPTATAIATETSNSDFKLLVPLLRVLHVLHVLRPATSITTTAHASVTATSTAGNLRSCTTQRGTASMGSLFRRSMKRSIGARLHIQSAEARAIRGPVRPFVRTRVEDMYRVDAQFA